MLLCVNHDLEFPLFEESLIISWRRSEGMASVIEDAETLDCLQQSSLIVRSDMVPLINPAASDLTAIRRNSSLGNVPRGLSANSNVSL